MLVHIFSWKKKIASLKRVKRSDFWVANWREILKGEQKRIYLTTSQASLFYLRIEMHNISRQQLEFSYGLSDPFVLEQGWFKYQ